MADLKTKKTEVSVEEFLNTVKNDEVRGDCFEIARMMKDATLLEGKMWGPSIVGFGEYHYKYESGREGDMMQLGFSPRTQNITLYILSDSTTPMLKKLGKHTTGKGCLYIKRLSDIDRNVLQEMINEAAKTKHRGG